MESRRKELEKRAGFLAFAIAEKAFSRKDPTAAERSGARLGMLFYRLSKKRRETALSNLRLAFPDMPENERIELAKRCFQHFGRITADFLRSGIRTDEEVRKNCPIVDAHHLDDALALGKGAILITGHLG